MADERRGRWVPLVYYYLASIIGLTMLLFGVIGAANGLVNVAFPRASEEFAYSRPVYDERGKSVDDSPREKAAREAEALERARAVGLSRSIRGGIMAVVAVPVFVWHLRQARRKEPEWVGPAPE